MGRLTLNRADDLEAEGHELIAKGHAKLAEATRLRSQGPANDTTRPSWIPTAASPLGNRQTLSLARAGAIESSKVGRRVLVRRSSLAAYLEQHRRDRETAGVEDEDLFAAPPSRPARAR